MSTCDRQPPRVAKLTEVNAIRAIDEVLTADRGVPLKDELGYTCLAEARTATRMCGDPVRFTYKGTRPEHKVVQPAAHSEISDSAASAQLDPLCRNRRDANSRIFSEVPSEQTGEDPPAKPPRKQRGCQTHEKSKQRAIAPRTKWLGLDLIASGSASHLSQSLHRPRGWCATKLYPMSRVDLMSSTAVTPSTLLCEPSAKYVTTRSLSNAALVARWEGSDP